MFNFICGEIVEINDNTVVLKNNGIGFELAVSNVTLVGLSVGASIQLFVYMQVKEDGFSLFGFLSKEEKDMFLRLISVSGVGPKVALSVLSGLNSADLALAILNGDISSLIRVKGLGKKTAERIILELKEKISSLEAFTSNQQNAPKQTTLTEEGEEAVEVLVTLGLNRAEAIEKVLKCLADGAISSQQILSKALRG